VPDDLREVYLGFGIDLEANNAAGDWRLPLPATFVVDTAGIVTFAEIDPDYKKRPEPDEVLAGVLTLVK